MNRLQQYAFFVHKCFSMLAGDRRAFAAFIALSVTAALTESFSVSLLVPILENQGNGRAFSGVPILGHVSSLFQGGDGSTNLMLVALSLLTVVIARGVLTYFVLVQAASLPLSVQRRIAQQCYDAILRTRFSHLRHTDNGALFSHLTMLPTRSTAVLMNFGELIWNSLVTLVYLFFMIMLSWWATVASLSFLVLLSLLLRHINSGPLRTVGRELTDSTTRVNNITLETLGGLRLIRLNTAESRHSKRFQTAYHTYTADQKRLIQINLLAGPLLNTGSGVFICILLLLASLADKSSTGQLLAQLLMFIFLMFRLISPVSAMNIARSRIVGDMHAFEQSEKFTAACLAQREQGGSTPFHALSNRVLFQDVSFSYGESDKLTLQNLDLEIKAKRMVALVGPSGAGKSTLVALLARFQDPVGGRILVDDTDLQELSLDSWRSRMAVVSQDSILFSDTVANNICFGRQLTSDAIQIAADCAAATEFIKELPQGYDTLLGEGGIQLSGGQKQRISIARAIAGKPDILVMDEATSHLDALTEAAIQQTIEQLRGNTTLIVIAHRLATLYRADKIVVLDQGRIVESGTHDELVAQQGLYWRMLEQQSFTPEHES